MKNEEGEPIDLDAFDRRRGAYLSAVADLEMYIAACLTAYFQASRGRDAELEALLAYAVPFRQKIDMLPRLIQSLDGDARERFDGLVRRLHEIRGLRNSLAHGPGEWVFDEEIKPDPDVRLTTVGLKGYQAKVYTPDDLDEWIAKAQFEWHFLDNLLGCLRGDPEALHGTQ